MPPQITETLSRLGLKAADVQVYYACLQSSDGLFAAQIQKATGIKRSTLDLVIDRLRSLGFLTYHLDGSRKRYAAESPETLLSRFEDSLDELKMILPLLQMSEGNQSQSKVKFFDGKEGLEKIFADILLVSRMSRDPREELLIVGSGKDIITTLPDHQRRFIDKRVRAKIPVRWIAPKSPTASQINKASAEELREMKFFDGQKYPLSIEMDIYGNNVALMSLDENPVGVIIENKSLASSLRSIFNLLWNSL
jgi:sugar-specific transcriptional regulator TrmB